MWGGMGVRRDKVKEEGFRKFLTFSHFQIQRHLFQSHADGCGGWKQGEARLGGVEDRDRGN